ncbi:MAG: phosphatase PAP2 family protein [Oscillospiraceae bacterium]|jgi:undecaprenyl-diphosphatase|nr:phosphatase PAP2 family protein [Oscillospiraceae bacterium]
MFKKIQNIDNSILSSIAKLRTPILDKFMIFITNLGSSGSVWLLFGLILLFIRGYRKKGAEIFVTVGLAALMSESILKNIIRRARPCDKDPYELLLIPRPSSYSFPSGHTTSSFATAYVVYKTFLELNCVFVALALFLAFLISFSRLYLKVHYPSDVLAGIILGIFCGLTVLRIF